MLGTWQMDAFLLGLIGIVLFAILMLWIETKWLRTQVGRQATSQDMSGLVVQLARMSEKQEAMNRDLHAQRQQVTRVEEFLLKRKGGYDSQF